MMKEFLLTALASGLGFLFATYVHGFIFSYFKADKYEDTLAEKIVKRIVELEDQ